MVGVKTWSKIPGGYQTCNDRNMWNGMIEIGLGERNKQIDDWLNREQGKRKHQRWYWD